MPGAGMGYTPAAMGATGMTAATPDHAGFVRRVLLAAVLLFAQLVAPALPMAAHRGPPDLVICQAGGTGDAAPVHAPSRHDGDCLLCVTCQACPLPMLAGPDPVAPVVLPLLRGGHAASRAYAAGPPAPKRSAARPRAPPPASV